MVIRARKPTWRLDRLTKIVRELETKRQRRKATVPTTLKQIPNR